LLASPYASAYSEWRETSNEIEIKGWREWNEKKMGKKENDTPEREKPLSQMDGRELLLEIMSLTAAKERTDDDLLQILEAIHKILSEPKGKGEK